MRTRTWRRLGWPTAGVLAIVVGAPSLAEAQQSGMFPLAPIQRQRVPCPMEDPVYKLYRNEYFGYHPTCWRRFPDGWGCPSPEAPNAAAEFQKLPRDKPPTDAGPDGDDEGPDAGPGAPAGMGGPRPDGGRARPGDATTPNPNAVPPLPSGDRSPFEIDTKPNTPPAATRSPFEMDPKADAPAPGAAPPRSVRPAPGGNALPDLPGLPQGDPAAPPPSAPANPGPRADASPTPAAPSPTEVRNDQPLLSLPDPTVGPSSAVASDRPPLADLTADGRPGMEATGAPAQAPRRTGLIGRLFNNMGLIRR